MCFLSAIPWGEDTDWNYWFGTVKKGAKTGKDNGFSVLFDIESFDYGYYDEGSEGLKVNALKPKSLNRFMMLKIILLVAIASVYSPCKGCVPRLLSSIISTCPS